MAFRERMTRDDEPVLLFEVDLPLRQAWWGIWLVAAFGAVLWVVAAFTESPLYLLGLVAAGFAGWANVQLRNVVSVNQELKWILLAVLGLVVEFGVFFWTIPR